jgi:phosphatase NudJ
MAAGITTWCFVLVAVRRRDQLLVVHEAKHKQRWWIPAGAVEQGETLEDAALRETREEAGLHIHLDGIIRFERSLVQGGARLRVIFAASALDDVPPKSVPDEHTLEARWCGLSELEKLPLRGSEPIELWHYFARGGPILPLTILTEEGAPIR